MPTQAEIDEILKFDPGARPKTSDAEIAEILKFDPVGGTFQEPEAPPRGAPTPAAPFPEYPGAYRGYNEPTEPTASFGALAKSALADDPLTKVKILAAARGIPLRDIARNYRFAKGGEIEFKTPSGRWQRETPEGVTGGLKQAGAQIAGHPSTYLGTAGAMMGGGIGAAVGSMTGEVLRKKLASDIYDEPQTPWGTVFDVALEGLLALGGETVSKIIKGQTNKFLMRKSKSLRFAGREIKEGLLTPKDHARALYIESLANQHGIKLQPHQLYNREGMTNIWMYLRKHPLTSNQVQILDDQLEKSTDEAIDRFVRELGGYEQDPLQMGRELKEVSSKAIRDAEQARQKTVGPYYESAFDRTPTIDIERLKNELALNKKTIASTRVKEVADTRAMVTELSKLSDIPTMRIKGETADAYGERISRDYTRITGKTAVPTKRTELNIQTIKDLRKRNADIEKILQGKTPEGVYIPTKISTVEVPEAVAEIDRLLGETVPSDPEYAILSRIKRMIGEAEGDARKLDAVKRKGIDAVLNKSKADPNLRRQMHLVKTQLTDAMDRQLPDYSAARGIYGQFGMAGPIDEMKNSVIGTLSKAEGYEKLEKSVLKLFGTGAKQTADQITKARNAIMQQDPELWRRAIGEYLKEVYYKITVTEGGTVVNSAGKMNKWLFGNKPRREAMAAAFGGADTAEYKTLKDLMTVLQRAAIGRSQQSMTAPFQQIEKELSGAMGTQAQEAFKRPYSFLVDKVFEGWHNTLLAGRQGALLDALTRPDVITQIKKMKLLKPGSKKLIEGLSVLSALTLPKLGSDADPDYEGMGDSELMELLQLTGD